MPLLKCLYAYSICSPVCSAVPSCSSCPVHKYMSPFPFASPFSSLPLSWRVAFQGHREGTLSCVSLSRDFPVPFCFLLQTTCYSRVVPRRPADADAGHCSVGSHKPTNKEGDSHCTVSEIWLSPKWQAVGNVYLLYNRETFVGLSPERSPAICNMHHKNLILLTTQRPTDLNVA